MCPIIVVNLFADDGGAMRDYILTTHPQPLSVYVKTSSAFDTSIGAGFSGSQWKIDRILHVARKNLAIQIIKTYGAQIFSVVVYYYNSGIF